MGVEDAAGESIAGRIGNGILEGLNPVANRNKY
jgi:hypothetical protein